MNEETQGPPSSAADEQPTRSTAANRIPLSNPEAFTGNDILGTCYVRGKVAQIHSIGLVVEFRNPDGGPYKVAVHAPSWRISDEAFQVGDEARVQFCLVHHAATVKDGVAVVGVPGEGSFFVRSDSIVE